MAHILLAWELGANLGHATRLRSIALALKARGHRVSFALRDVVSTRSVLGPELGPSLQAPLRLDATPRAAWSLPDVLLTCGYDSLQSLSGLAAAWHQLIELTGCDVVLADHAPTALLAARLTGLPALHVGHGFSIPPRQSPLPVFRDWAAVAPSHAAESDARVLAHVNAVLATHGKAPLPQLCDLFYPEQTWLCTWPELDHCAGAGRAVTDYKGPDCEFQPGTAPHWPATPGSRVFAYLRASHPDHAEVLRALHQRGLPTVCFFPDRAQSKAAEFVSPHVHFSEQPLDLRQVMAECALVVCHAGQATVAQALRAAVPCLLLPTQSEQFLLARQAERCGFAINAASRAQPVGYGALLAELSAANGGHTLAARTMARKHEGFDPAGLMAQIAEAAEALACRA
jgi:Glycosyltransferase family 28 C-terminal domain